MTPQRLFYTSNLKTATALLTLGFKKVAFTCMVRRDGKDSTTYWFEPANAAGLSAEAVLKGMTTGADALAQKDPENVINYLRAYAANRDELITDIKATPKMVVIEVNGRQVAVSENASDATKLAISKLI